MSSGYEELARAALLEAVPARDVGPLVSEVDEGEGVVTLLFECELSGYPGWKWAVSVARVGEAEPTVLESELLPGEGALLAPEWVPWSERLEEYRAAKAAEPGAAEAGEDEDEADDDAVDDDAIDEADLGDDAFDGVDLEDPESADEDDADVSPEAELVVAASAATELGVDEEGASEEEADDARPHPRRRRGRGRRGRERQEGEQAD